ncbi:MAG: hypothetical protein ABI612_23690 [Betaproteobacteria bacterium]
MAPLLAAAAILVVSPAGFAGVDPPTTHHSYSVGAKIASPAKQTDDQQKKDDETAKEDRQEPRQQDDKR